MRTARRALAAGLSRLHQAPCQAAASTQALSAQVNLLACSAPAATSSSQSVVAACYLSTASNSGSGHKQGHSSRGWWAGSGSYGSSAAAWAASLAGMTLLLPTLSLADAGYASGKGGKGTGDGSATGALQAVQSALQSAWSDVKEDLARISARLPAGSPPLQAHPPQATLADEGLTLEVRIPLRTDADSNAVLSALTDAFSSPSSSSSNRDQQGGGPRYTSTSIGTHYLGTSKTVQLEVVSTQQPGSGGGKSVIKAQLFVPPPGGSEQAELTVQKRCSSGGGACAFTDHELAGLQQLVRVANTTYAPGYGAWSGAGSMRGPRSMFGGLEGGWGAAPWTGEGSRRHGLEPPADVDRMLNDLMGSVLGSIVMGPLSQIMEEMQRAIDQGTLPDPNNNNMGPGGGQYPGGPGGTQQYPPGYPHQQQQRGGSVAPSSGWGSPAAEAAVRQLQSMGVQVHPPKPVTKPQPAETDTSKNVDNKKKSEGSGALDVSNSTDWGVLAGYEGQKRQIEDCLLLPLLRPDVYSSLAKSTRAKPGSNRPRAVLFEGPPGTGKTTSARVISSQAAVPLVYVPLEAVLSKWYGESEGLLAKVFKAAEALGGAIIFIDELDAIGGTRDRGDMHEASRRLLSVLLREMDGFDAAGKRAVVIGATNRKSDLDPALLSRFDMSILFDLPDEKSRALILGQYAQQLKEGERKQVAAATPGLSGRDLRDVCEHTERRWASKIIRGEVPEGSLPPVSEYLSSAKERVAQMRQEQQQQSSATLGGMYPADLFGGLPTRRHPSLL